MTRDYRILVARTDAGLFALAGADWEILRNTIREFARLDSDDDHGFGDMGGLDAEGPGLVALAYRKAQAG